ncbi:uncharacterized protein ARMOST_00010 [Armillaria ostoyae]|uniref:Uncharacterized protein n=1 Tax=Armillaria ostoyae TaxID=47428 RepID=A0A284QJY0_ARMOS|nr:uncharacterized protein ARMOST_00010 [Armillaria ostoyae]
MILAQRWEPMHASFNFVNGYGYDHRECTSLGALWDMAIIESIVRLMQAWKLERAYEKA